MRILVVGLALLLPCSVMFGQEKSDAEKAFAALEASYKATMDAYSAEIRKVQKSDAYKKAREANDREATTALFSKIKRPDTSSFVALAQACAKAYEGTEDAVPFLGWAATNCRDAATVENLFGTVCKTHLESKHIAKLVGATPRHFRTLGKDKVKDFLSDVIAQNKHSEVLAEAYLIRGEYLGGGEDDLKKVVELVPDSVLALRAQGPKFEEENLQIGMKVPDIVGEDLDGVEFKLSDYHGKVVVLDFWGDW